MVLLPGWAVGFQVFHLQYPVVSLGIFRLPPVRHTGFRVPVGRSPVTPGFSMELFEGIRLNVRKSVGTDDRLAGLPLRGSLCYSAAVSDCSRGPVASVTLRPEWAVVMVRVSKIWGKGHTYP